MTRTTNITHFTIACALFAAAGLHPAAASSATAPEAQQSASAVVRRVGAIKAINGTTITLTPDSGAEVDLAVTANTRILRTEPGEKDLKNATPAQLQDLQIGDRILVGGKPSDDGKSIVASVIVVMKRSDLDARRQQEREDWQKRGIGGLVKSVDADTGTVTISVTGFGGSKNIAVHTTKTTVIRRYAPDSVKFDDAKASTLAEIHPNDQLRARGERNADGAEFSAEEIVSGAFRNIAGTVNSVDASAGTINVQDLVTKKSIQVKVTPESQLRKLPAEVAQRIAMRLKSAAIGGIPGVPGAGGSSGTTSNGQAPGAGAPAGATPGAGGMGGGGMRAGGAPDFSQMLGRMPAVAVADLHKGDAIMLVATEGSPVAPPAAVTLLAGVEPILQAAPSGSQAAMLTPWSLSAPAGDAGNP